jgi:hypothetical protein
MVAVEKLSVLYEHLFSVYRIGKLNLVDLAGSENIGEWLTYWLFATVLGIRIRWIRMFLCLRIR